MKKKTKAEKGAEKRNATRDLMRDLPAYCARRGYVMPAEFLVAIMNGEDPRAGLDCEDPELTDGISIQESLIAARTLAKYLYATAQRLDVTGGLDVNVPPVVVTPKLVESLTKKLKDKKV